MKQILITISFIMIVLSSCKVGRVEKAGALENQGYLQFVSQNTRNYSDGVDVFVDNLPGFKAKVDNVKPSNVKGNTYVILNGTRRLRVEYDGYVLYEKDVVISIQETRTVRLP